MKKWTVLIYLAGDNNLSPEMIYSLMEMKRAEVGPDKDVTVVAQFDPKGEYLPTQRFVINSSLDPISADFSRSVGLGDAYTLAEDAVPADDAAVKSDLGILPAMVHPVASSPEDFPSLKQILTDDDSKYAEIAALSGDATGYQPSQDLPGRDPDELKKLLLKSASDPRLADDTGNPWTLLRFLIWGIEEYQADHYMVVLSGHGSGSDGDFLNDDSSGGSLTIRGLAESMKVLNRYLGKPIDILGLDTCLMSMAEVYYQVGKTVKVLVGSEGVSPNAGWPYCEILNLLTNPAVCDLAPEEIGRTIVRQYAKFYSNYALSGLSSDISALSTDDGRLKQLERSVLALASELIARLEDTATRSRVRDAVLLAHWTAQTYKFDQYVDLYDFCRELAARVDGDLKIRAGELADAIENSKKGIVIESRYVGPMFQYSHGLSVYFPWATVSKSYLQLCFAKKTKWGKFIQLFIEDVSRRPARCGPCDDTGNEVLNRVFRPAIIGKDNIRRPLGTAQGRDSTEDPCSHASVRFTAPCDRGPGSRFSSLKNSPIEWCPLCGERAQESITD